MSKIIRTVLIIVLTTNLLAVVTLIQFAWTGTSKAIIVVVLYYFGLIVCNIISWVLLDYFNHKVSRVFKISTIILVILILPFILLSIMY